LRRLLGLVAVLFIVASGLVRVAASRAADQSRIKADQAAAEAESANHSAEARRLEVLTANASKAAPKPPTRAFDWKTSRRSAAAVAMNKRSA
jgi:hypothetical protein